MPFRWPSVLLLISLVLLTVTLTYQIPRSLRVEVGSRQTNHLISGFYFAEGEGDQAYRWSGEQAVVAFPAAGVRNWTLHLRVGGLRPQGPVPLTVSVNDHPALATLELGGQIAEYTLALPRHLVSSDGDVMIRLDAPTFTAPPDPRELGVQVAWLELRAAGPEPVFPGWKILLGASFILLVAVWGMVRLGARGVQLQSGIALGLLLVAVAVYTRPWSDLYLAAVSAAALAFGLVSGWMRGARWWEWGLLLAVAAAAVRFGARAWNFYQTGLPPGDFSIYFTAAQNLAHGLPLYDFQAAIEMPNGPVYKYPPLFAILLAPFTPYDIRTVAAGWYLFNLLLYAATIMLMLRLVISAADARHAPAPATLPLAESRRVFILLGTLAALIFLPTWESLIRGQLDVIILAAAVAGLWAFQNRRAEWVGGLLLAVVTMLKLYPALLWLYLVQQGRRQAAIAFAGGFVVLGLFSAAVVGWDVIWRYATEILTVQTAAVPYPENQSWTGLLSRLVIPAAETTWYTTIPFNAPMRYLLYALVLLTFAITVRFIWQQGEPGDRRTFLLGYTSTLLVIIMIWPTSWIHYQTLALPICLLLLHDQLQPQHRHWGMTFVLLSGFLLLALGNEYSVLTPWMHQDGWPRLLQSYKFYGMLLLWALALFTAARPRSVVSVSPASEAIASNSS